MRWTVGALVGAAVLVFAAGCGTAPGDSTTTPAPGVSNQPGGPTKPPLNVNVAEALKTAEQEFTLLKKGDWAGAWQLWTETAKKEVPKKVFVDANKACPKPLQRDYQLQNVQPVSNELIELTFRRGDQVEHGALRPAESGWQFEPGTKILVEYANGADDVVSKRKSANQCS